MLIFLNSDTCQIWEGDSAWEKRNQYQPFYRLDLQVRYHQVGRANPELQTNHSYKCEIQGYCSRWNKDRISGKCTKCSAWNIHESQNFYFICTTHSTKMAGVYLKSTISSWTTRTFKALEKKKKEFCIKKTIVNRNVSKNSCLKIVKDLK